MKLRITHVYPSAIDAVTIRFEKPKGFVYASGQYGSFAFHLDGNVFKRTYSFQTAPTIDEDIAITIRAVPDGIVSNFLVRHAHPAMVVELDGVFGAFTLAPMSKKNHHLIFLAGGSGITPIMSMIKTVLTLEPFAHVSLIYANQTYDRIIFQDELAQLNNRFRERFTILHIISKPETAPTDFKIYLKERLSKLVAKKTIRTLLSDHPIDNTFYLCGPIGFMNLWEDVLRITGNESSVHKEHFYIPTQQAVDVHLLPSQHVLVQSGNVNNHVRVLTGQSILQAALQQGIRLSHSCTEGHCGVCRAIRIQGEVKMLNNFVLTEDDLLRNEILLCQGYPFSDNVIVKQEQSLTIL